MRQRDLAVDLDAAVHLPLELLLGAQLVGRDSISVEDKDINDCLRSGKLVTQLIGDVTALP